MLVAIVLLLLFLVPGLIAALAFQHLCGLKLICCKFISLALVFDLLIIIVNFLGLWYIKHIYFFPKLIEDFSCLRFTSKYGILSIVVGLILAAIFGLLCRLFHKKAHHKK